MPTIDTLELEIQSNSASAVNGINALSASLSKLKNAVQGGVGLNSTINQINKLNSVFQSIDSSSAIKIDFLHAGLSKLSQNIKISPSIGNQLRNIGSAVQSLNTTDFSGIEKLSSSLNSLKTLGKSNLKSFITQLSSLPQVAQTLQDMNIDRFTNHIQQLAGALAPLANQLNTVSTAVSRLPSNIKKTADMTFSLTNANSLLSKSYINFWAKISLVKNALRGLISTLNSMAENSTNYIEDLNLFSVSLGEYASEAKKYAEQVGEIMGLDPGKFMRNQGVFMTITKGFGVASDRAYTMSKNLTQLGYDLSSFFNISFEDSMQKLTSGISGELEPLRRLGYDLSQARLKAVALSLGIDKTLDSMTQAEKAQLRYHAIMTQVTSAQGDMARTLENPSNQLRILNAQVEQASRALGNLFIPILTKVMPYAIAFAKVIRILANTIASLFGINLPEMDFSSLGSSASSIAESMEDTKGALGGANKEAKKLKNALLGIDELNIISEKENSPAGGSGVGNIGGVGGGFDFELPTYDFLGNAVNKQVEDLVSKFKEWAGLTDDVDTWAEFFQTRLGRILILVGEIAAAFLAWKLAKSFMDGLAWIQNLKNLGLGKELALTTGIVLTIAGLTIEWTGLKSIITDGIDKLNLGETILGSILTVIGGGLIGNAASGLLASAGITSAAIEGGIGAGLAGALFAGGLAAVVAGVPAFAVGIWSAIKEGLNLLNGFLIGFGATLTGAGIGAMIGALGGPIGAGIGALIGLAVGLITDFGIWLYQNWDSVKAWFIQKWEDIKDWWNNSVVVWFKGLPKWFKGVLDSIGKWFAELPGKIGHALGFAMGKIVSWGEKLKEEIPKTIDSIGKWFKELPVKIREAVSKAFSDVVNNIVNWVNSIMEKIREEFPKIIDSIVQFFKGIPDKLEQLGTDIWQGLINGLNNAWEGLKKAVKDFVDGFIQGFKDGLGIHSPSTEFESIGGFVVEGFQKGIELFSEVSSKIREWSVSVIEWFTKGEDGKGITEHFTEVGSDIVGNFKNTIENKYINTKSNMITWAQSVKTWFSDNASNSSFAGFATDIIDGFKEKIGSTYTDIKSNITTWASDVKKWFSDNGYGGVNNTNWQTFANNVIEGFRIKIGNSYTNTKHNITTWASDVKRWFSDNASGSAFSNFAVNVIDGFKNRIGDYYITAESNMKTFGNSIKTWFTDSVSYNKFYDVASDVVNGFKNGIGELYENSRETINRWGESIVDWFKERLDVNSPSREFYKIGGFTVVGFNNAIQKEGRTTKSIIANWSDSFTDVSPRVAFALDTSAIEKYNPNKAYMGALSSEVRGTYQVSSDGFVEGMEELYKHYVEPILNRIAEDVKRQADKEEQTIVQVGNRVVTDAVTAQRRANGYNFAK